jgi:hypothetical protein
MGAGGSSPFSRVPHDAQNFELAGLMCRHAPQRIESAAPQELQNRLSSATSDKQLEHCMATPTVFRFKPWGQSHGRIISRPSKV